MQESIKGRVLFCCKYEITTENFDMDTYSFYLGRSVTVLRLQGAQINICSNIVKCFAHLSDPLHLSDLISFAARHLFIYHFRMTGNFIGNCCF